MLYQYQFTIKWFRHFLRVLFLKTFASFAKMKTLSIITDFSKPQLLLMDSNRNNKPIVFYVFLFTIHVIVFKAMIIYFTKSNIYMVKFVRLSYDVQDIIYTCKSYAFINYSNALSFVLRLLIG